MAREPAAPDDPRFASYRLQVFRVKPDTTWQVRTLSTAIGGLMTHWRGNRSYYCNPGGCESALHRAPSQWKGYFAGEYWLEQLQRWFPICCEITEACELDMRGQYRRGQVWQLSRDRELTKKKKPVRARLLEICDERTFPHPFDILPAVRTLYHVIEVQLDTENPMPAMTMVVPSEGAPPKSADKPKEEKRVTPQEYAELMDKFKNRAGQMPNGNGSK